MPDLIKPLLSDARSYARPYVRRLRGVVRATCNDVSHTLGAGVHIEEPLRNQWLRILRRSRDVLSALPELSGPRVLFATGYGLAGAMMTLESVLVMALRMRGALPTVLLCDKILPACEWNRFGNFVPSPDGFGPKLTKRGRLETCRICTENILDSHGLLPVPKAAFSEYIRPGDLDRASKAVDSISYDSYRDYTYRDIRVGEHAFASVMRTTLRGTLVENEETRRLFRRYLIAAMLVVDLTERVFREVKPERVVAIHGVYVTHGTICETAQKHDLPVIVYGTPYRLNTVWLSHGDTYHRTLITEPTSRWENIVLGPEMEKRLDEYLASKRLGGRDYAAYHVDAINDRETLVSELHLNPDLPIISLFTNVLWDAQLYYKYNAFGSML